MATVWRGWEIALVSFVGGHRAPPSTGVTGLDGAAALANPPKVVSRAHPRLPVPEVTVPRMLFTEILRLIAELRPPRSAVKANWRGRRSAIAPE